MDATADERIAALEADLATLAARVETLEGDLGRAYLALDARLDLVEPRLQRARDLLTRVRDALARGRLPGLRVDVEVQPRLTREEQSALAWLVEERRRQRASRAGAR